MTLGLIRLLALGSLLGFSLACSPLPDWKPKTVEDQAINAGIVIEGEVSLVEQPDINSNGIITINLPFYHKGCGPTPVRISGFTNSAMCGIDAPVVGSRVTIFGCENIDFEINADVVLNEIDIHTGMIYENVLNDMEDKEEYGLKNPQATSECGVVSYLQCTKDKTAGANFIAMGLFLVSSYFFLL